MDAHFILTMFHCSLGEIVEKVWIKKSDKYLSDYMHFRNAFGELMTHRQTAPGKSDERRRLMISRVTPGRATRLSPEVRAWIVGGVLNRDMRHAPQWSVNLSIAEPSDDAPWRNHPIQS
ncbi:hypothetical protein G6K86_30930 [Agrobacterium rhizogenes]|nr:hypothetical protein [Rhizobium rhizogenes]